MVTTSPCLVVIALVQVEICHMTSQNHVTEGSCNFKWEFFMVTTLASLVVIYIVVVETCS